MNYTVRREEQEFGPYTLTDLQEYVGTGHVLPGDLAKGEGMADWVPISQVLGNVPITTGAPAVTVAVAPLLVKLPPNLHWIILAVLVFVTRQMFNWVWVLVQANWARKLAGSNKPLVLTAMYPASFLAAFCAGLFAAALGISDETTQILAGALVIGGLITYMFGIFAIRSAMEDYYNSTENINLRLSGVMTWFFSTVYFQYHINQIAKWKKKSLLS